MAVSHLSLYPIAPCSGPPVVSQCNVIVATCRCCRPHIEEPICMNIIITISHPFILPFTLSCSKLCFCSSYLVCVSVAFALASNLTMAYVAARALSICFRYEPHFPVRDTDDRRYWSMSHSELFGEVAPGSINMIVTHDKDWFMDKHWSNKKGVRAGALPNVSAARLASNTASGGLAISVLKLGACAVSHNPTFGSG